MEFIKEIKIAVTALIGLLSGIWGWMGRKGGAGAPPSYAQITYECPAWR